MKNQRIVIVDALRGLALFLIILIHFIEHFDFFAPPEFRWIIPESVDTIVYQFVMFVVGGKAFSIFAILFGFSFFLQLNRSEHRGIDFRSKFLWRLAILLVFGFFHSLIYKGDILHIYALMGMLLIPLYKLNVKYLAILAAFFLLQVPTIIQTVYSFIDSGYAFTPSFGWGFWAEIDKLYQTGSLWEVIDFNLWKGRTSVWGWIFYTGRYLQIFGLFILGLIIGKTRFFENLAIHKHIIKRALIYGLLCFAILLLIHKSIPQTGWTDLQKDLLGGLLNMYSNLAATIAYMAGFTLFYLNQKQHRIIATLAIYGKMSLTNYVTQALFGVFFFYGFGLGMYRYLGPSWSILMGLLFFITQIQISKYWIKRFHYGPFEWLWRVLTFLSFSISIKKNVSIKSESRPV